MGFLCRKIWENHLQTPWEYIIVGLAPWGKSSQQWLPPQPLLVLWKPNKPSVRSSPPPFAQESLYFYSAIGESRWQVTMLRKWGHKAKIVFLGWTLFQRLDPRSLLKHWELYLQVRGKACYCCCILRSGEALTVCTNPPLLSKDAWHQRLSCMQDSSVYSKLAPAIFVAWGAVSWQPVSESPVWACCAYY